MAASLFTTPAPALDSNANPYSGAIWHFYVSGGTTPHNVYSDAGLVTSLGSTVTADAGGKFVAIYLDDTVSYRGVLKSADGATTLYDIDPINNTEWQSNIPFSQSATYAAGTVGKKLQEVVNPRDAPYYATVNGSTDDTDALNDAMAAAAAAGRPLVLDGTTKVTGPLHIPTGLEMFGATQNKAIIKPVGNFDLFNIEGSWTRFSNFRVDNTGKTGGYDFDFDINASGTQIEHDFSDIVIDQSTGGVKDTYVSGAATEYRIYFHRCKWTKQRGNGFYLTRAYAFYYIDHECLVEYVDSSDPNHIGLYYNGTGMGGAAGGLHTGLTVAGSCGVGTTNSTQVGFDIRNAAAVYFLPGSRAENMGGKGVYLDTCNNAHFEGLGIFQCNDHGLDMNACTYMVGDSGISVTGRKGLSGAAASKHGIRIIGSDNVDFAKLSLINCTGDGINVATSTVVDVGHIASKSNTGWGIYTDANGVVGFKGGNLAGNTAGNYTLGGANHYLRSMTLDAGTCVDQSGAGTA